MGEDIHAQSDAGARCDFARLGAAYVESTRPRTGHTARFIDKMPLNFFYAPLIQRALPECYALEMIRDYLLDIPRAVEWMQTKGR